MTPFAARLTSSMALALCVAPAVAAHPPATTTAHVAAPSNRVLARAPTSNWESHFDNVKEKNKLLSTSLEFDKLAPMWRAYQKRWDPLLKSAPPHMRCRKPTPRKCLKDLRYKLADAKRFAEAAEEATVHLRRLRAGEGHAFQSFASNVRQLVGFREAKRINNKLAQDLLNGSAKYKTLQSTLSPVFLDVSSVGQHTTITSAAAQKHLWSLLDGVKFTAVRSEAKSVMQVKVIVGEGQSMGDLGAGTGLKSYPVTFEANWLDAKGTSVLQVKESTRTPGVGGASARDLAQRYADYLRIQVLATQLEAR